MGLSLKQGCQGRLVDSIPYQRINQGDMEPALAALGSGHKIVEFRTVKRCFKEEIMRGDKRRSVSFFRKGHPGPKYANRTCPDSESRSTDVIKVRYVRPTEEEESLLQGNPVQPLAFKGETDAAEQPTTLKLLRSTKATRDKSPREQKNR